MTSWDFTTDILVVGSGGGGMAAALTAKDLGNDVVLIEKGTQYGGSTALSGGALWAPNNPLMHKAGIKDSPEDALSYLNKITNGSISEERLKAYIKKTTEMITYLEENTHASFQIINGYPDYYPDVEGGRPNGGRTLEPLPFNARLLKDMWKDLLMPPAQEIILGKVMITADECKGILGTSFRDRIKAIALFLSFFLNPFRFLARSDTRLTLGNALIGRMRLSMSEKNIPLWLNTPARELISEGGRVAGIMVERDGKPVHVKITKGIIFAAGGFENNQTMREQYQPQPVSSEWTMGTPDNTGDVIQMGMDIGAGVSLMDEAWWMPTALIPPGCMPWYAKGSWWEKLSLEEKKFLPWFVLIERSLPGTIIVNSKGRRFINEAVPYIDFVKAQKKCHENDCSAIPSFMISDQKYNMAYPLGPIMVAHPTKKYIKSGFLYKDNSLAGLAEQCGIDSEGLQNEVNKFNQFAVAGKDSDFNRGESPIDTFYSDPAVQPNPCLAPIKKPPFYAIKVYPGDLGTKGGLNTDEYARVLDKEGNPIKGLYATGNCTSSVMGGTYPGAGGTIGPSMTFGYIAAQHASEVGRELRAENVEKRVEKG